MQPRRSLFVFVKEPHPGRVKTRLGAGIGMVGSAWWFRRQSQRLIRQLSADPRWDTYLAVSPDREGLESRVWPAAPRRPQGQGDLGDRMARTLRSAPPGPAMVVGADIPDITPADIESGFRALGGADAVVGPAEDGGYWLIGLKRRPAPAGFLEGVRWSTEYALSDTIATLGDLTVARLRTLNDVDEVADLA